MVIFRLAHSLPVTRLAHSLPVTRLAHSVPETRLAHSLPVTRLAHSVPETRLADSLPVTRLAHSQPVTRLAPSLPVTRLPWWLSVPGIRLTCKTLCLKSYKSIRLYQMIAPLDTLCCLLGIHATNQPTNQPTKPTKQTVKEPKDNDKILVLLAHSFNFKTNAQVFLFIQTACTTAVQCIIVVSIFE